MTNKNAVLLMAYGGPESLDDVAPYLADVRRGRPTPPELIEAVSARYAAIGGKSPLLGFTQKQAAALEKELNTNDNGAYRVFIGMRHWKPTIREALTQIRLDEYDRIIALCMTPFSSSMSTGAYFEKLETALDDVFAANKPEVLRIGAWYDNPAYIQALAKRVRLGLEKFKPEERDQVQVLFTAHSLPAAILDQHDPYPDQFAQLASHVAAEADLAADQWTFGYQSAGASSIKWLGPSLQEMITSAAARGARNLLAAPIGFLTDHVEILYDIDIEAKDTARTQGVRLERTLSLNHDPDFIQALVQTILKESVRV